MLRRQILFGYFYILIRPELQNENSLSEVGKQLFTRTHQKYKILTWKIEVVFSDFF